MATLRDLSTPFYQSVLDEVEAPAFCSSLHNSDTEVLLQCGDSVFRRAVLACLPAAVTKQ